MWFRPRTETFSINAFWWHYHDHPRESALAATLALLNLALVAAAVIGFLRSRPPIPLILLLYILARCALIATMENSEPRYTLEAFPILFLCAGAAFSPRHQTISVRGRPTEGIATIDSVSSLRLG